VSFYKFNRPTEILNSSARRSSLMLACWVVVALLDIKQDVVFAGETGR
jgi:hypothetical protein